jgi:O-antigen/teichoic acid export membrane protein
MKALRREEYFGTGQVDFDLKSRTLRGGGATVFSQVLIYGIQMVGTIVLARILKPSDFGLVAMVTAFSFLFQNFGLRGFTEATIQSDMIDREKISTLFWIQIALSVGVTLLFIGLSPIMAWFYDEGRLVEIAVVIGFSFVFNALATQHLALLQRNMQFYRVAGNEMFANIITQIVAIGFAVWGWGYWALVARRVVPLVAVAAGAWILCRWVPGLPGRDAGVKSMLKFGMHTYGNFATNYFSRNLDKVLVGWRYGAQSLGQYERAYYLFVMPVNQLSNPLTGVAVAALSRLRDDREKFRRYYLKGVSVLAVIGMPLSSILTLTGKDLLLLLLGAQWTGAGEVFTVFGPAIGITLVYGTHGWLHLSLGRADRWLRWGIVELVVCGFCFVLGLAFGAIGVAIGYTASFYALIGPGLWYAGKPANITFFNVVSAIWKYCLSALVAGMLTWIALYRIDAVNLVFAGLNIFARIVVSGTLCLLLYVALGITLFGGKSWISEFISLLLEMMRNIRSR